VDKKPSRTLRAAEANGALEPTRSTLGDQPAGLTLRSSSRSAMAEVKVENKGRVNLFFVLQAMHLDTAKTFMICPPDMVKKADHRGG